MTTMHAFRIHRFGGPDAIEADRIEVPEPNPGEVRVQIVAASLNPVDYKTRSGRYPLVREDQLPYTLGRDFSGLVDAVGEGVCDLSPGDAVYAFIGQSQGAFAEYVCLPATALARMPTSLDFRAAAAVPLAALTAWQGLFDHGALQSGQRVLIHAAAGGVGHFAVQFARVRGAHVTATTSSDALDFVARLGADEVIDYRHQRFEEALAAPVDLVFDLVGGDTQARSWRVLRRGGAMVSTVLEPSPETARQYQVRGARYTARPDAGQLAEIARLIDSREVGVHVAATFDFADLPVAEGRLEAGHVRGKLVLDMRGAHPPG